MEVLAEVLAASTANDYAQASHFTMTHAKGDVAGSQGAPDEIDDFSPHL